jgi:acyl-CoA reductase-like NAD-dependent aldehyde dehydrogenase
VLREVAADERGGRREARAGARGQPGWARTPFAARQAVLGRFRALVAERIEPSRGR